MTIKVTKIETERYILDLTVYIRKKDNDVRIDAYDKATGIQVMEGAMIIDDEIYYHHLLYNEIDIYICPQCFLENVKIMVKEALKWTEYWNDFEVLLRS